MTIEKQAAYLKEWQGHEEYAERMLPIIGRLYRDHNVVTTVYGRSLVNSPTIDLLKAHVREVSGLDAFEVPVAPGPVRDRALGDAIRAAFGKLPAKLQAAASLALIEEESNAEIAAALGISVAAVKSRIHRAIGMLRTRLRRLQVGHET